MRRILCSLAALAAPSCGGPRAVLGQGAVTLPVLRRQVGRFIAEEEKQ